MSGWRDLSVWQRLLAEGGGASGVVAAASAIDSREAGAIARLRRRFDADLVSAALELAEARRKAAAKFGADAAAELWCDVQGVEQASGSAVAAWKAGRIRAALGSGAAILDLCCGIGGDSIALARSGLAVTAVDLDARRAWMAGRNAGCATQVADVETLSLAGAALHVDPARRDEAQGRRGWSLDDHRPGRAWIERAFREARAAAVKFAPGVDRRAFDQVAGAIGEPNLGALHARPQQQVGESSSESSRPEITPESNTTLDAVAREPGTRDRHGRVALEWEWIEERGTLVQAVAWSGAFAREPGRTRATVLAHRETTAATMSGVPDDARMDRLPIDRAAPRGAFLCEPTPSLERARLLAEAAGPRGVQELARDLGLLVSAAPLPAPWFESFEIVADSVPDAARLRELLAHEALVARSVRVRGGAADADRLTRELACRPGGDAVVFIYREESRARAVVARARR